ncbi:unnamed protein product [marine sediment metagenome]|uniref:Big-1 domain-containing protein n=1 Tax=marine sediment metagenome TaxID=412755 RepID=X1DN29_9ZZZZ
MVIVSLSWSVKEPVSISQRRITILLLATLTPFVHSISLQAVPAVIPADHWVSSSQITAVVKSQFLLAISGRQVNFADDDSVGYLSVTAVNTDSDGVAQTVYYAGDAAREVKITATAKQS